MQWRKKKSTTRQNTLHGELMIEDKRKKERNEYITC